MSNRCKVPGRKADPGGYTVRHPSGTYLVRYAQGSGGGSEQD